MSDVRQPAPPSELRTALGQDILTASVTGFFSDFRMLEGWWEAMKVLFHSDFVEWVEEQRAKAA